MSTSLSQLPPEDEEGAQSLFEAPHDIYASQNLPDDLFYKWWGLLAEEDRSEFKVFYQGDEILARFVCVLDYLIMQKVQGEQQNIFALAYHIAAKKFPEHAVSLDNPAIRTRSARAWQHPAVQALMDRVKYRATRSRILRIENMLARNLESMLEDSNERIVDADGNSVPKYDMKDRQFASTAAIKYMELAARAESEAIAIRTRLGLEKARKAIASREEEVDPRVLEQYAKLFATLPGGKEKLKALLGD